MERQTLRIIDTGQYVTDRINQIAELLEVVDNSSLRPGEVTSGPRTVFQRLPRHMRRRAMSYNVKRLPRSIRHFASRTTLKTTHRKKAPSRKWRRRPSRLLKRLKRIQRKNVWLETHIWHAKRFRMVDIWGWKLPLRSYQRGFRPTYRDACHATVIVDHSYLCCVQISSVSGDVASVLDVVTKLTPALSAVCAPFSTSQATADGLEASTLIYEPGEYPFGFVGPVRFSWAITGDSTSCQLWSHPSTHARLLALLTKLNHSDGDPSSTCSTVKDLRHEFVRIRLIGTSVFQLLSKALHLVSDDVMSSADSLFYEFRESNRFWRERVCPIASHIQAGYFRVGTTLSLLVEDPRLFRAQHTTEHVKQMDEEAFRLISDIKPPSPILHRFWDLELQKKQLSKRYGNSKLEHERSAHSLSGLTATPFKIPILLIVRNVMSSAGGSLRSKCGAQNRIDLIAPAGTGMDFWLALHFTNGRAAGLADRMSLDFESGALSFPADCADSTAADDYQQMDAAARRTKHLKKPANRRVKYGCRLRVTHPFRFEWAQLVAEWNETKLSPRVANVAPQSVERSFFVLRDRRVLVALRSWMQRKNKEPNVVTQLSEVLKKYASALVAIRAEQMSRGRIGRLALICLPSDEDLKLISENKNTIIEELKPDVGVDELKSSGNGAKKEKDKVLEDFIPMIVDKKDEDNADGSSNVFVPSAYLQMNDLFPDETALRVKRKAIKKAKRRDAIKKKKRKVDTGDDNGGEAKVAANSRNGGEGVGWTTDDGEDGPPLDESSTASQSTTYKNSCSRTVIGRVVRGDYSFAHSRGVSFGYCPLSALRALNGRNIVLLRNTTSKYYHPATVEVLMSSTGEL